MENATELMMAATVSEIASGLGFEVVTAPRSRLRRGPWHGGLSSLTRARVLRPDLLVKHNGRSVVVEIKRRGVLFGAVAQVLQYAEAFDAAGVLCVPDGAFEDTPLSVLRYADAENVLICPMSDIGDALTTLLGQTNEEIPAGLDF